MNGQGWKIRHIGASGLQRHGSGFSDRRLHRSASPVFMQMHTLGPSQGTCICLSDRQANCDPSLKGQIGWAKGSSVALWTGVSRWRIGDRLDSCKRRLDVYNVHPAPASLRQVDSGRFVTNATCVAACRLQRRDEVWLLSREGRMRSRWHGCGLFCVPGYALPLSPKQGCMMAYRNCGHFFFSSGGEGFVRRAAAVFVDERVFDCRVWTSGHQWARDARYDFEGFWI